MASYSLVTTLIRILTMSETIGAALHAKMKELAAAAVLKCYVKYLVKSGISDSADAVKEKIGTLCSTALDRGEISQDLVACIISKIDRSSLFLKSCDSLHSREKFIDMALVHGLMHHEFDMLSGEDAELVAEARECFKHLLQIRNKIVEKYGDLFLGECLNFYNEYKNLFDSGFEKHVREMTGDNGTESHITL